VIQEFVPKPLAGANITSAAMFRTIERYRPTLLIDEADTFLPENEELRGVINSGHGHDGAVIRLVGEDHEPRTFSTFCPTAIAAIGDVPSTIEDRSITIAMRRRLPGEKIERFRRDHINHLKELVRKAFKWVADHEHALLTTDPEMPDLLHDRACDNWRVCFAIADCAGGEWAQEARGAALALSVRESEHETPSGGAMLLTDIRQIFEARRKRGVKDADRISSNDLVAALMTLTDRPWGTWSRGKPITSSSVARLLKPFNVFPHMIRLVNGSRPNGYKLDQFDDAFGRYLPSPQDSRFQGSDRSDNGVKTNTYGQNQGSDKGGAVRPLKTTQHIDLSGLSDLSDPSEGDIAERRGSGQLEGNDDAWLDELLDTLRNRSTRDSEPLITTGDNS
jgi:putative DNA primase/helicase